MGSPRKNSRMLYDERGMHNLEGMHSGSTVQSQRSNLSELGLDKHTKREQMVYNGFGRVGYYCPNAYFQMPFHISGTVVPQVLPLMILSAAIGQVAYHYEVYLQD